MPDFGGDERWGKERAPPPGRARAARQRPSGGDGRLWKHPAVQSSMRRQSSNKALAAPYFDNWEFFCRLQQVAGVCHRFRVVRTSNIDGGIYLAVFGEKKKAVASQSHLRRDKWPINNVQGNLVKRSIRRVLNRTFTGTFDPQHRRIVWIDSYPCRQWPRH
jgi:hypothetical protein